MLLYLDPASDGKTLAKQKQLSGHLTSLFWPDSTMNNFNNTYSFGLPPTSPAMSLSPNTNSQLDLAQDYLNEIGWNGDADNEDNRAYGLPNTASGLSCPPHSALRLDEELSVNIDSVACPYTCKSLMLVITSHCKILKFAL